MALPCLLDGLAQALTLLKLAHPPVQVCLSHCTTLPITLYVA